MMEEKTLKVEVTLKAQQARGSNRYEFTHFGEVRQILEKNVQYYVADEAEARASFNWNEVEEVRLDGVQLLQKGEKGQEYSDFLAKALTKTNMAFLQSIAWESGDYSLYGTDKITYQGIIDLLTPAMEDLRQCIQQLEILKQKRTIQ